MKRSLVRIGCLGITALGLMAAATSTALAVDCTDVNVVGVDANVLLTNVVPVLQCDPGAADNQYNDFSTFDAGDTFVAGTGDPLVYDASAGSNALIVQKGFGNKANTLIIQSPGTEVFQGQFGMSNDSDVLVVGGALNDVNVLQKGIGFTSDIVLLNSEQTTVNNFQGSGSGAIKTLIVVNGKPGTQINMN